MRCARSALGVVIWQRSLKCARRANNLTLFANSLLPKLYPTRALSCLVFSWMCALNIHSINRPTARTSCRFRIESQTNGFRYEKGEIQCERTFARNNLSEWQNCRKSVVTTFCCCRSPYPYAFRFLFSFYR